jgi:hypothetical protein
MSASRGAQDGTRKPGLSLQVPEGRLRPQPQEHGLDGTDPIVILGACVPGPWVSPGPGAQTRGKLQRRSGVEGTW